MEAKSPDAGLALPAPGHRIKELVLGKRRVEGGVEGGDFGDARQTQTGRADSLGREPIVQWRKDGELLNALENTRIDAHRRSKSRAAVDDPMPNRLDLGRAAQLPNQILDRPPEIASLRRVGP